MSEAPDSEKKETNGGHEDRLVRERDVHRSACDLASVARANDRASGFERAGLDVGLRESAAVGAAEANKKSASGVRRGRWGGDEDEACAKAGSRIYRLQRI